MVLAIILCTVLLLLLGVVVLLVVVVAAWSSAEAVSQLVLCIRIRIMVTKDDNLDLRKETSQKSRYFRERDRDRAWIVCLWSTKHQACSTNRSKLQSQTKPINSLAIGSIAQGVLLLSQTRSKRLQRASWYFSSSRQEAARQTLLLDLLRGLASSVGWFGRQNTIEYRQQMSRLILALFLCGAAIQSVHCGPSVSVTVTDASKGIPKGGLHFEASYTGQIADCDVGIEYVLSDSKLLPTSVWMRKDLNLKQGPMRRVIGKCR
jgi:hypothetical protein